MAHVYTFDKSGSAQAAHSKIKKGGGRSSSKHSMRPLFNAPTKDPTLIN